MYTSGHQQPSNKQQQSRTTYGWSGEWKRSRRLQSEIRSNNCAPPCCTPTTVGRRSTVLIHWTTIYVRSFAREMLLLQEHRAPAYLADYCVPVSTVPGRHHLRSARRHQLYVPPVQRSTFGTRAFSVAGPTVWNSLPDDLHDPTVNSVQFRRNLKTYLFAWHLKR